jgi:hypothetical protein
VIMMKLTKKLVTLEILCPDSLSIEDPGDTSSLSLNELMNYADNGTCLVRVLPDGQVEQTLDGLVEVEKTLANYPGVGPEFFFDEEEIELERTKTNTPHA